MHRYVCPLRIASGQKREQASQRSGSCPKFATTADIFEPHQVRGEQRGGWQLRPRLNDHQKVQAPVPAVHRLVQQLGGAIADDSREGLLALHREAEGIVPDTAQALMPNSEGAPEVSGAQRQRQGNVPVALAGLHRDVRAGEVEADHGE